MAATVTGSTRLFALLWISCIALIAAVQMAVSAPVISQEMALLILLGFFGCTRPIRLGSKLEICVAQPACFAALLISGTSTALLVAIACVLGASFLRRRRPAAPIKIAFNLATGLATVLVAGGALILAGGPVGTEVDSNMMPPLLAATVVAFIISTVPVAMVAALETGQKVAALWADKFLPAAPAYLAGSGLALLLVLGLGWLGSLSFVFFVPLVLSTFNSSLRTLRAR